MHAVTWFEIPTVDLERAARFYEAVLGIELTRELFMGVPHAIFPGERADVRGALIRSETARPSPSGLVVYLHAPDLDASIARVERAGGRVIEPRTAIGPAVFIAIIEDPEGNRLGLHARA